MARENYVELALSGFNAGLDLGDKLITARERLADRADRRAADAIGKQLTGELKSVDDPVTALKEEMRMFVEEAAIKGEAPDEKKLAEYQRRLILAEADRTNRRADLVFSRMAEHGSNKYAQNVLKPYAEAEMERFQQMQQNSRHSEEIAMQRERLEYDKVADTNRIAENQRSDEYQRETQLIGNRADIAEIGARGAEERRTQQEGASLHLIEKADEDADRQPRVQRHLPGEVRGREV